MLETLEPQIVLVYGSMNRTIFEDYLNYAKFVRYPDWISKIRGGEQ